VRIVTFYESAVTDSELEYLKVLTNLKLVFRLSFFATCLATTGWRFFAQDM